MTTDGPAVAPAVQRLSLCICYVPGAGLGVEGGSTSSAPWEPQRACSRPAVRVTEGRDRLAPGRPAPTHFPECLRGPVAMARAWSSFQRLPGKGTCVGWRRASVSLVSSEILHHPGWRWQEYQPHKIGERKAGSCGSAPHAGRGFPAPAARPAGLAQGPTCPLCRRTPRSGLRVDSCGDLGTWSPTGC